MGKRVRTGVACSLCMGLRPARDFLLRVASTRCCTIARWDWLRHWRRAGQLGLDGMIQDPAARHAVVVDPRLKADPFTCGHRCFTRRGRPGAFAWVT